jgi:putative endonuclease
LAVSWRQTKSKVFHGDKPDGGCRLPVKRLAAAAVSWRQTKSKVFHGDKPDGGCRLPVKRSAALAVSWRQTISLQQPILVFPACFQQSLASSNQKFLTSSTSVQQVEMVIHGITDCREVTAMVNGQPVAGTVPASDELTLAWRAAETAAHRHILQLGYQPVARNVRSRYGEIDIVAKDGETMTFIEVKARRGSAAIQRAGEAVDLRKQHRLRRLALSYLKDTGRPVDTVCRFDVVIVKLDRLGQPADVDILRDAF